MDPDGDSLSYRWQWQESSGSKVLDGASASGIVTGGGSMVVTLTVTDSRGAVATRTLTTNAKAIEGTWLMYATYMGTVCGWKGWSVAPILVIRRTGRTLSGEWRVRGDWCWHQDPATFSIDPGTPATIDDAGLFTMRIKDAGAGDMFFKGVLESNTFATATATMQGWDGIDTYAMYRTTAP